MKNYGIKALVLLVATFLTVSFISQPVSADPSQSYSWGSYTVDGNSSVTFTIDYNGGEWGDAKAVPRYTDDDIDMKVYDTYGFLEASDTTHVSPHCQWWVGLIYSTESFRIKIINNGSDPVHFQFKPY